MNKEKKQKAYSHLGATEGYFVDKKILSAFEEYDSDEKEFTDRIIELDPQECDGDEIAVGTVLELLKKTQYDYDLDNFIGSLPETEGMSYDEARTYIESQGIEVDDKGVWIPSGAKMTYLGTANGWPSFQIGDLPLDFAGDILSFKILEESAKEEVIKDEKESTDKMPKEACAMESDYENIKLPESFSATKYKDGRTYVRSNHPYDLSDYHWAYQRSPDSEYGIYLGSPGRLVEKISVQDLKEYSDLIKRLTELDKKIRPVIDRT